MFDVEINTKKDPLGGMNIVFRGIDLLDKANYTYIDGFYQDKRDQSSNEIEAKYDLKVNTFASFIDYIKSGFRFSKRNYSHDYGSRSAGNLRVPMSALPDYKLTPVGQGFVGTPSASNANWLIGDGDSIRNSWDAFRAIAVKQNSSLSTYYPAYFPSSSFNGNETTYAAYAMAHYNFNLLFPIEGIVGARLVNITTRLNGFNRTIIPGILPNGLPGNIETAELRPSTGNSLNVLPSANAIMHFTDKLQLRASYTYDVGRPSAFSLNPNLDLNATNIQFPSAYGGNADLRPVTTSKYDLSLEYYFGKTGSLSVAAWDWSQDGFEFRQDTLEVFPGVAALVRVSRPLNAGRGRHRGIEISGTTFFSFLPGILSSFGASGNFTYNKTRQAYPSRDAQGNIVYIYGKYFGVAPYTFNINGFFERGGLNARVAYNWTDRRETSIDANNPYNNQFFAPIERLDASVQYDINKHITIAAEATNLTADGDVRYYGSRDFPAHVNYFSRTFSLAVRTRF